MVSIRLGEPTTKYDLVQELGVPKCVTERHCRWEAVSWTKDYRPDAPGAD